MPLSREDFEASAVQILKKQAESHGVDVDHDTAQQVVKALSNIMARYAERVASDERLHHVVDGIVRWTPERDAAIQELSAEMNAAFAPIIDPSQPIYDGVLWSGPAKKRALEKAKEGKASALEGTLWGAFLEDVTPDMNDCFFEGAYTAGHAAQTAGSLIMWDATSRAFAQKMEGDVEVTLMDASTRSQSVFFNTELPRLRALQEQGVVKEIYLSTFTPEATERYGELLNKKAVIETALETAGDNADAALKESFEQVKDEIQECIKDPDNWQRMKLDRHAPLELITGGRTNEAGKAKFSSMIKLGEKWQRKMRTLGSAMDPLLNRIKYIRERRQELNSVKVLGKGSYMMMGHTMLMSEKPAHPNQPSVKAAAKARSRSSSPTGDTGKTTPTTRTANTKGTLKSSKPKGDAKKLKEADEDLDLSIRGIGMRR